MQMKRSLFILIITFLAVSVTTAHAATFHIKLDGTGDFTSIQDAIDAAEDGDVVIVHPGTYYENIHYDGKNITLRSTDPADWDVVEATIIDGGGINRVVDLDGAGAQGCELSGFTITNGWQDAHNAIHSGDGAGVANGGASITHCIITGNESQGGFYGGGGLYGCSGEIRNCIITHNTTNNLEYPPSGLGGGLCGCNGIIENCIIAHNWGKMGGGLSKCNGTIKNCVIANNRTAYGEGSGLLACKGEITNCIIWGNYDTGCGLQAYSSSTPTYSCLADGPGTGEGNISEDPLFLDADFHLHAWSPCINAGTNSDVSTDSDLDSNPRIVNVSVDIGAYEYPDGCFVSLSTDKNSYSQGDTLSISLDAGSLGHAEVVDAYLAIQTFDGAVFFLPSMSALWDPMFEGIRLPAGYRSGPFDAFSYAFSGDEPYGEYSVHAALFRSGSTSADDLLTNIAQARFTFGG